MALVEIGTPARIEKLGRFRWRIRKPYLCPNAEAIQWTNWLYDKAYIGLPGASSAPRCTHVEAISYWEAKQTLLIATYDNAVGGQVAETATVEIAPISRTVQLRRDLDGKLIHGDYMKNDHLHTYMVVRGSPVKLEHSASIIITAATRDLNLLSLTGKWDHVNSSDMPKVSPDCKAGTMLLAGTPARKRIAEGELWKIRYPFLFNPEGWNESVKSQLGFRFAQEAAKKRVQDGIADWTFPDSDLEAWLDIEVVAVDDDGVPTASKPTSPESRRLWLEADFSALEAIIVW